ncbi:MAG: helix-turn-helix domain-containing protein [Ktedonobacterales bacterium]
MSFLYEERLSDSPYVATVMRGRTASGGTTIRPADCHWYMVVVRYEGNTRLVVSGPWTKAGILSYPEGVELVWIKFALGTFMPYMLAQDRLDQEVSLPEAAYRSFLLNGSAWQFPDYENVETFVDRLVRGHTLVRDPVVHAALQEQPLEVASRTVRHRFKQSTGLTRSYIQQVERAQRAAALLQQGVSIPDAVYQAGYFDQPHLTRSLKHYVGHTPAEIVRMSQQGAPE